MTFGLTLGKFAPLHRGHQRLIEVALAEVDRLAIMVYDSPETTSIPLPVRSAWLRRLYPQAEVIDAWDGPTKVGSTPEIEQLHERYILSMLRDRKITHFYSSEFYGTHVSRCLGAMDRRVDPDRLEIPISATEIRADPYQNRQYLAPIVYRDLITRVVFLGAPSTGKSTIARHAALAFETAYVPEYGREYWEKHRVNRRLSPGQLVEIAEGHRDRVDDELLNANKFLFVDTDSTTTYMFSLYYHGHADARLTELAEESRSQHDLFFLCDDDFPYDDTWDRSGPAQRGMFQKQIRADLIRRRIPFLTLRGSVDERMSLISSVLRRFDRYESVANHLLRRPGTAGLT
jgi:HTH-type transcriptional regulator, transcriptional repressor of NAD biosynthesis genes